MSEGFDGETVLDKGDRIEIRKDIAVSPRSAWSCLTDPRCLKSWWRENVEFEAREGGRFVEPWIDPSGRDRTVRAQVTSLQPYEGFVMVWADDDWTFDTIVAVTLTPIENGTRVSIEHHGWEKAPEADRSTLLLDHEAGWSSHLGELAAYAEGLPQNGN